MKRSLSSLITDTNVREYKIKEIDIEDIAESNTQARKTFDNSTVSYTHLTLPTTRYV